MNLDCESDRKDLKVEMYESRVKYLRGAEEYRKNRLLNGDNKSNDI